MTTLQFVDTHNLVAFLAKPAKSEGFKQVVDFLNASSIKYALTGNPTIYTSCIEQFWSTVKAKMVNREVQLQALMDIKKIVVTEASVRRDLQLEDANGIDCLPNATIFEQLTLMGAKTTAWNEFSSTMASAIICLAINQKFNFSKYIFESMVKNLDSVGKFLMYPRFVLEQGKGSDMPTDPHHTPTIIPPSTSQPQRKHRPRKPKRKDTEIPQSSVPIENVADKAVYKEKDDSLERVIVIATGLDVEQDIGNISKTRSKETPNEPSSIGTNSGGGPRRQDTMRDTISQTRSENVSKFSNDPLLARVNIPQSGEDSMQLQELMEFCTKLQQRVLNLENTKAAQAHEIISLKKRVKKLERKKKSRTHGLKRLYKRRKIHDIDADNDITLDSTHFDIDPDMFGMHDLDGDEVFVETKEPVVNAATTTSTILVSAAKDLSDVDMTLAQALAELKSTKPKAVTTATTTTKAKGLVIQEQEQASTPITSSKDKKWGCIIAQAEEQEKVTIEENLKLFQQFLRKGEHFAVKETKKGEIDHPQKLNKGV
ncbi:hypothetical protein Tco_0634447 [Tanacetum coccineum]